MKNSCMHPHLKKNRAFRCCWREEPSHTSEEIWVYVCSSDFIQRWWSFIFLQNIILKEKSYYLRQVAALPNSPISLYCCLLWLSVNIVAPWSLLILSWFLREGCVVLVFHLSMESEYFGGTPKKLWVYCLGWHFSNLVIYPVTYHTLSIFISVTTANVLYRSQFRYGTVWVLR